MLPLALVSLLQVFLCNVLINNFVANSHIQLLLNLAIFPDGQKGLYLRISICGIAVCLGHTLCDKWFTFEEVQLFTRNAQAPNCLQNWLKITS
jgi:hypothetical protein